MKKIFTKKNVTNFLLITLGSLIAAFAVAFILEPLNLAPGGVSGIAIILCEFIPISTGIVVLCLNVPLLIIGLIKFGKNFLFNTVYATVLFALSIDGFTLLFGNIIPIPITNDYFLASVFGGALSALGYGLVFRCGFTTGGTDIIVKLLRSKYRHIKTGAMFLILDLIIAAASAWAFDSVEVGLYATVAILVNGLLMDFIIYGGNEAKLIFIISEKHEEIYPRLLNELDSGGTALNGQGLYTNKERKVLMVCVKKHVYPKLRDVIKEIDPKAFMIVTNSKDTYGEGYQDHLQDEL